MNDHDFLKKFEDGSLDFQLWTHTAHLRMAWIYLRRLPVAQATQAICQGIKHFNSFHHQQLKVGYHETITWFWINRLIQAQLIAPEIDSFPEFQQRFSSLFAPDYLNQQLPEVILKDPRGKHTNLCPPLSPLEET